MNDVVSRIKKVQREIKDQGADVAVAGGWYNDNPHQEGTPDYQLWILGFDEGLEVNKRVKASMVRFKS